MAYLALSSFSRMVYLAVSPFSKCFILLLYCTVLPMVSLLFHRSLEWFTFFFTVLKIVTLILHCSLNDVPCFCTVRLKIYLALVLFPIGRQHQVQVWGGLGLAGSQIEQRKGLPLHPALTLDISRQSLMVTF